MGEELLGWISEYASEAVEKGLWINQEILIQRVKALVKRRVSCAECRKMGREKFLILNCKKDDFAFFSDRCSGGGSLY